MITPLHIAGLIGQVMIGLALWVLARLSRRLGNVTRAKAYFRGLYVAAGLVWSGVVAHLYFITRSQATKEALESNMVYTLLSDGLPALGTTLGLLVTWYYWSWLLAERD